MNTSNKRLYGRVGLLALAAMFIVAVSLSNHLLRGVRLDLTENRLYTLSDGTLRLLDSLEEPVNLYFFWSDRATADVPYLRTYAGRVREMLQELAQRSGDRLRVTVIDPIPFSDDEDRAAQFGLRGIELTGARDPVYLGIAATNSVGDRQVLPFLDPGKEAFLEYDLARLIYALANPERPVVGLLSGLPMAGGFDPMMQQPSEPWVIHEQVAQLFDLRTLGRELEAVDADVDVLMLVHPKDLPDSALYAIDQFILRGGRALLFLDPWADLDLGGANPMDPMAGMMGGSRSSTLEGLLDAWGLSIDADSFIGDDRFALTVSGPGQRPIRHLGFIGIGTDAMSGDDVITAGLDQINLGFAGAIRRRDDAAAALEPLLVTSELAGSVPSFQLMLGAGDPDALREGFSPEGESLVLAARVTGRLPSAFPQGRPVESEAGPALDPDHLAEASEPVNLVLVADTDLLADRLWVQQQSFFGQRVATAFASNGDFVISALDNLSGSGDLISIRSRATFSRPFTRVEDLRREAENRFRITEQRLQQELQDTEARLAELQASREDSGALILSPAQEVELERFRQQRLQIRRDLRQVQRNLDQSIEALGTSLKVINIGLVPLFVGLAGMGLLLLRRRRRGTGGSAA
jgi:ABC-type uncharacterized transport system involved in gliding motility auxiliary subunit